MAPNPRRQDEALEALYAELPTLDCQGLCHDACGPIDASVRERQRVERAAGKKLECGVGASCSMLTADRRCGVYDLRPLICRVWGITRKMRCHYGCRPSRWLTDEEVVELIARADLIGGEPKGREARLRQVLEDHAEVAAAAAYMASKAVVPRLEARDASLPKRVIDR